MFVLQNYGVLLHALKFYEDKGKHYDNIVLLQNTSPFRKVEHLKDAIKLYSPDIDMVVSVVETSSNPYYNCFEEDDNGYLHISKGDGKFVRRQDVPTTYAYNGAIYIINPESLKRESLGEFKRRVKYVMDETSSVDLDTMLDWSYAEFLIKENIVVL